MRSERRSKTIPALAKHLEEMATIVHHQRPGLPKDDASTPTARRVREVVAVVVFEEPDGSETIEVLGDAEIASLELKGVLHDGLYAMTHVGDEGFSPE